MRRNLVDLLVDHDGTSLDLEVFSEDGEHVFEGVLRARSGYWFPIRHGVPSFLTGAMRPNLSDFMAEHGLAECEGEQEREATGQAMTATTFSDKWRRFRNYGLEPDHQRFLFEWYCRKLGVGSLEELQRFYAGFRLILEVGPGSGFNTRFMAEHCSGSVVAADISDAAFTTFENTADLPDCHVIQADLMKLPLPDARFDFVIADGVLHHTPDTRAAVGALYKKLRPGGEMFFYLYRQMGPARRFVDDYLRSHLSALDPETCYEACEAITELGRELSRLQGRVTLTKPIPLLGIPAGEHDVQRLVYYNFLKCFWSDAFDFETNNMVNFDWYHPHHAWQHTEEEVRAWLDQLGAKYYSFQAANPNGLSVLFTRT